MYRPPRIARARAVALPRPQVVVTTEWLVALFAVAVILAGLLGP
jgi:hypothetical protein